MGLIFTGKSGTKGQASGEFKVDLRDSRINPLQSKSYNRMLNLLRCVVLNKDGEDG